MKKLMLVVSVLFFAANVFAGQIVPKLGYQMNQTGTLKGSGSSFDTELDAATSIGAEYLSALNDMFMVGGGFEYQ
ncbi:MAG: hypothetical protein NT145_00350, partial [Elusimicrobia bacterium]|nr:hypothetical protein [Elusimicrobiota bacterium]